MVDTSEIREHAEVVGSDDEHIGTIDKVEGDQIKLTKRDSAAEGRHHYIALDSVESVEDGKVRLNISADEAMEEWDDDDDSSIEASAA